VGCGVLGVGGVLVGVALTVWLGSMALSGSTGGGGTSKEKGGTIPSEVSALSSSLDDVQAGVPGMEPSGAALQAPGDLAATGTLALRGANLSPGPIEVSTCLARDGSDFDTAGCDPTTTVELVVDAGGRLTDDVAIHRTITVDGTAYDCAARAGACVLFGHRAANPLDTGLTAPLSFVAGLPPVDAVAPPG
jgi:hypothetical protein